MSEPTRDHPPGDAVLRPCRYGADPKDFCIAHDSWFGEHPFIAGSSTPVGRAALIDLVAQWRASIDRFHGDPRGDVLATCADELEATLSHVVIPDIPVTPNNA